MIWALPSVGAKSAQAVLLAARRARACGDSSQATMPTEPAQKKDVKNEDCSHNLVENKG
jgi:hypothetical protein